jgi:hypothetical protein
MGTEVEMTTGKDTTADSILYVPGEPQVKTVGGQYIDSPFESDYNVAEDEPTDAQEGDVQLPDNDSEDSIPNADTEDNKGDQQPDAPDPIKDEKVEFSNQGSEPHVVAPDSTPKAEDKTLTNEEVPAQGEKTTVESTSDDSDAQEAQPVQTTDKAKKSK